MANAPFFSIVIPAYNRASYIGKTLQSVLNQSCKDFEVLVVDDGSADNTGEVVAAFHNPCVKYFKKENGERGAARNYGVRQASGKYVTFLDSDDLLRINHLEQAKLFLEEHPGADIFHLGYDIVDPKGKILTKWKKLPNPINRKLVEGNFLSCLGVFARREILLAIPFNEDRALSGSEDYELWVRLASKYEIKTKNVSTACLVNHDSRSVLQINPEKFKQRIFLFKEYLKKDKDVVAIYGRHFKQMFAYKDLYAALHLAISNNKKSGLHSLWLAVSKYPGIIGNYRFWVVIKKIVLN
jgi:glycosyltransferase involved in cell wall biosynthesis